MKTALITGASSGIGRATAVQMARLGFHVVAAGRSDVRTLQVVDAITGDGGSAEFLHLDLESLSAAREAAQTYKDGGRPLDVLINNAGIGGRRGVTKDGFELQFGVNHLGHFMLTHHLRQTFHPGTRIVVVSSEAHRRVSGIDWVRVHQKTRIRNTFADYGVSKLANVLFARRLAELEPDWRTYSLHPGLVNTNIFPTIAKPFFRNLLTPQDGAQTSVWCATSEDVANHTGSYYSHMAPLQPSPAALDDDLARELWKRSERWCGIAPKPK